MPETIREEIILSFMARAAEILTDAGYVTDIGAHVLRAIKDVDPSLLPACSIFPQPDGQPNMVGGGEYLCQFQIRIEAIAEFGAENPSVVAERMLGDLRQAFMSPDLSTLIDNIQYYGGGTDDYPDSKSNTISAYAVFYVSYFTKIDDPYS